MLADLARNREYIVRNNSRALRQSNLWVKRLEKERNLSSANRIGERVNLYANNGVNFQVQFASLNCNAVASKN